MDVLSWYSRFSADPAEFSLQMDFVVFDDVALFHLKHSAATVERQVDHVNGVSLGHLFYFVISGSLVLSQNGARIPLSAGTSAIASGYTPHRLDVVEQTELILVVLRRGALRGRGLPEPRDEVHRFPATSFTTAVSHFLHSLTPELPRPLSPEGITSRLAILHLLAGVITGTVEEESSQAPRQAVWVAQALTYIEANYVNPNLTTAAVATATGISPRHLQRLLAASSNSVADELRRARVRWATVSLRSSLATSPTLREVAERSGFGTVSRMRRAFHREIGMSPAQYRASPPSASGHAFDG